MLGNGKKDLDPHIQYFVKSGTTLSKGKCFASGGKYYSRNKRDVLKSNYLSQKYFLMGMDIATNFM